MTYSQSILEAATSGDTNMIPTLMDQNDVDQNNARLMEHGGAGASAVVGSNVKTEPSVKEGERVKQ